MLTKVQKQIGISDFRKNLSRYMKDAKKNPVVIATDRGEDMRVVVDAGLYNELVGAREDQFDAQCLVEEVRADQGERVLWADIKKKHGL